MVVIVPIVFSQTVIKQTAAVLPVILHFAFVFTATADHFARLEVRYFIPGSTVRLVTVVPAFIHELCS